MLNIFSAGYAVIPYDSMRRAHITFIMGDIPIFPLQSGLRPLIMYGECSSNVFITFLKTVLGILNQRFNSLSGFSGPNQLLPVRWRYSGQNYFRVY